MTTEQSKVATHPPTACSGYVDGKCIHGHEVTANFVCGGHPLLASAAAHEEPHLYGINKKLLTPACLVE